MKGAALDIGFAFIWKCRPTSMEISVMKIRRSDDSLVFKMEVSTPEKRVLILKRVPYIWQKNPLYLSTPILYLHLTTFILTLIFPSVSETNPSEKFWCKGFLIGAAVNGQPITTQRDGWGIKWYLTFIAWHVTNILSHSGQRKGNMSSNIYEELNSYISILTTSLTISDSKLSWLA